MPGSPPATLALDKIILRYNKVEAVSPRCLRINEDSRNFFVGKPINRAGFSHHQRSGEQEESRDQIPLYVRKNDKRGNLNHTGKSSLVYLNGGLCFFLCTAVQVHYLLCSITRSNANRETGAWCLICTQQLQR